MPLSTRTKHLCPPATARPGAFLTLPAMAGLAAPGYGDRITFCHATASGTNPFGLITTDPASIIGAGHGDHDDIIPAFDYSAFGNTPAGHFAGLNLLGGGEILEAGCWPAGSGGADGSTASRSGRNWPR